MSKETLKNQETPSFPTFRLGIILAGAVSAGAYTAGVMDYLLECLCEWDKLKEKNKEILKRVNWDWSKAKLMTNEGFRPDIPMHNVVIEILAGASAGGMTAGIVLSSLFKGIDNDGKNSSLLYDAWVRLNEENSEAGDAFLQMLENKDLKFLTKDDLKEYWEGNNRVSLKKRGKRVLLKGGVQSIFNSNFIEEIAEETLSETIPDKVKSDWYNYISRDVRMMLTICSLRGVPINIHFDTDTNPQSSEVKGEVAHKMFIHKGVAHFRFDLGFNDTIKPEERSGKEKGEYFLVKSLEDNRDDLKDAAIATGAFPFAFKSKVLAIEKDKLAVQLKNRLEIEEQQIDLEEEIFRFRAIDGGTINNEPISEVEAFLKEKESSEMDASGVIMIDPFPNFEEKSLPEITFLPTLPEVIPRIINTIRHQAMVKEQATISGFDKIPITNLKKVWGDLRSLLNLKDKNIEEVEESKIKKIRGLIFPHISGITNVLACGGIGGFAGFFSKGFRDHDYDLGKVNCEGFLRKYYGVKRKPTPKIYAHKSLYGITDKKDWEKYLVDNTIVKEKDELEKDKNTLTDFYRIIPALSSLRKEELAKVNAIKDGFNQKKLNKLADSVTLKKLKAKYQKKTDSKI